MNTSSEIIKTIIENLFWIVTGETGSGKTTQISQYVVDEISLEDILTPLTEAKQKQYPFELNNEYYKTIKVRKLRTVVTQPRRVAAIQMAKRVALESGTKLGKEVGYSIRFEDWFWSDTIIKYVTDGILVREWLSDPDLNAYDVVILDEAHERSMFTDILFSLVKQAVVRRKGTLRLVVTSATLQTELFSNFFYKWPIIEASGRWYPVKVMYIESHAEKRVINTVKAAIRIHLHEGPGDILAFLTGFDEWDKACKIWYEELQKLVDRGKEIAPMLIMPLYGSMNTKQQTQIFQKTPEGSRKLVFCTNIAETSLTVDGIAYVIDWGLVKQKMHNPDTGMEALVVVPWSKVQAMQRTGRAGRTMEGKCFRLYSAKYFEKQMHNATIPEILRTNLTSTVLTLLNLGIRNVMKFDFIENPERQNLLYALKQLFLLRAIDKDAKLTELGKEMNRFPLEPSYAKILLASKLYKCQDEMVTLVSILSTENIWVPISANDEERFNKSEEIRKSFMTHSSDHYTLVNIFKQWKGQNYSDSWLSRNFLLHRSMKQARKIRDQLLEIAAKIHYEKVQIFLSADGVAVDQDVEKKFRRCLTEGFYMNSVRNIADNREGKYLTVNESNVVKTDNWSWFEIYKHFPDWLLYTELVGSRMSQNGRMRLATEIKVKWIEK